MQIRLQILFFLFSCIALGQSFGQDTSKTLPVVVANKPIRMDVSHTDIYSASPTFILSQERLASLGALDIGEALRFVPGVQLKDFGGVGGLKTVSYRSLGSSHTAVLLDDNVQLNNQTGSINLSSFETFGLNGVIFSSGQPASNIALPSAYLPANSIALSSQLVNPPTSFSFKYRQNMATVNAFESAAIMQLPIGGDGFIGAQVFSKYGSGAYDYKYPLLGDDQKHTRMNSRILNHKIRIAGGTYLKHGKIFGTFFYNENNQQLPGAVILYNPSNDQTLYNQDYRGDVNWMGKITKNWMFALNGFGQSNQTVYNDPTFLNSAGFLNATYKQEAWGSGFILNRLLKAPKEKVFAGFDIKSTKLMSSEFNSDPRRLQTASVIGVKKWIKRFRIEANLAHQYIADQPTNQDSTNKSYSKLSPYLAIACLPFKNQPINVRAFYKHAFRMPSFNDLYYNYIGNSQLKPENAHITNLGISYANWFQSSDNENNGLKIEATVDGYYNEVSNKIVAIPTKDLFNWSMQNIGKTEAFGVDISLMVQRVKGKWKYGASTQQSINKTVDITDVNSPSYGHQIPYTPAYNASYSGNVSYKGYQFDANLVYTGGRYSLNENIYSNFLNPFIDINLGVQKEFRITKSWKFAVNGKVMNLLNNNYEVIKSFPMPGRYYQLSLKITFK